MWAKLEVASSFPWHRRRDMVLSATVVSIVAPEWLLWCSVGWALAPGHGLGVLDHGLVWCVGAI